MAYTKNFKQQLIYTVIASLFVLLVLFSIGLAKHSYQKGLEDGLYYNEQLKEASKYIPNK